MNSISYTEKIIFKQMMFKKRCLNVIIPIWRPKTQFTWNLCIINQLYQFHSLYVINKCIYPPNISHCLTLGFMVTLLSPNIKLMAESQHVAYLHIGKSCQVLPFHEITGEHWTIFLAFICYSYCPLTKVVKKDVTTTTLNVLTIG